MKVQRNDEPGAWHHVCNRALAKRSMFDSAQEIRQFLALLEHTVEAGLLEVIAFSILTSHFHLLVRSPVGELSKAMCWIESNYCQGFNRTHGRDGPLVMGRFSSRRIEDEDHKQLVLGYIDWNPVDAGIIDSPERYAFGSAWHYVRSQRPKWLSTEWLDELFQVEQGGIDPDAYRRFSRPTARQKWLIEARLQRGDRPNPEQILRSGPIQGAVAWFRERAELADGTASILPVACPEACEEATALLHDRVAELQSAFSRRQLARQLQVGLTRQLTGLPGKFIALRTDIAPSAAHAHLVKHRRMILDSREYAQLCADAARLAIDLTLGGVEHPGLV